MAEKAVNDQTIVETSTGLPSAVHVDIQGDIEDGTYQCTSSKTYPRSTFRVGEYDESMTIDPKTRQEWTDGDRYEKFKLLSPEEQNFIKEANRQGKGVHWQTRNGTQIFSFQPDKGQREAAAKAKAADQNQAQEEKKKGGMAWWKWALIGLGTVGLGVGLYFLLRKKKSKSSSSSETTKEPDPTPTTGPSNEEGSGIEMSHTQITPPVTIEQTNPIIGGDLTVTLGQNSGGVVDLGSMNITGNVSSGLTSER